MDRALFYRAGLFLVLVGTVVALPAMVWAVELLTRPGFDPREAGNELPRWVIVLLFAGWMHVVYAVYVMQWHHGLALDVVATFSAVVAATGAVAFGWLLFGNAASPLAAWLQLRGTQEPVSGAASPAALWCLVIVATAAAFSVWANGCRQRLRVLEADKTPRG